MVRQRWGRLMALAGMAGWALVIDACGGALSAPTDVARPTATVARPTATVARPTATVAALATVPPPAPGVPVGGTATPHQPDATPASTPPSKQVILSDEWRSPDGRWAARMRAVFGAPGERYETRLTVTSADGTRTWTPVAETRPTGLGFTTPAVLTWSKDGRRLYYTNLPHPGGAPNVTVNGSDLWRLDLDDGRATRLAPDLGAWLALSPDETQLAFVTWDGQVGVRDISTGAQHITPLPEGSRSGTLEWTAPARLLLTTADGRRWRLDATTGQATLEP